MRTPHRIGAGLLVGVTLLAPLVQAAASAAPTTPNDSSARSAPRTSATAGTLVDAQGRVVGGWVELGGTGAGSTADAGLTTAVGDTGPSLSYGRQDVGGGVWTYGSYDESGQKHCWSKYYNVYSYHSATAIMSTSKKVYAWPYEYADAHIAESIQIGAACRVYWGVYP